MKVINMNLRLYNRLQEYQKQLEELSYDSQSIFKFPLDQQFTLAQGNRKSIAIGAINLEAESYDDTTYDNNGDGSTTTVTDDICYVASTINAWSKNNIIGRTTETFHNIHRMFPWDGQQFITLWILNSQGRRIDSPAIKGSFELELIIDNENTFSYE